MSGMLGGQPPAAAAPGAALMGAPGGEAPAAAPDPNATAPDPAHPLAAHLPALADAHQQAQAKFAQAQKIMETMNKVREQMIGLVKLSDTVQPEDVVAAAGKLVSGGIEPMNLATMLADMPETGGEPLAAWIAGHAQTVIENSARAAGMFAAARHELGVAGMSSLMAHSIGGQPSAAPGQIAPIAPQPPAAAAPNPLLGA